MVVSISLAGKDKKSKNGRVRPSEIYLYQEDYVRPPLQTGRENDTFTGSTGRGRYYRAFNVFKADRSGSGFFRAADRFTQLDARAAAVVFDDYGNGFWNGEHRVGPFLR
jgi:hypothetical protein